MDHENDGDSDTMIGLVLIGSVLAIFWFAIGCLVGYML